MDQKHDLELILRSRTPLVVIETQDEARILEMLQSITLATASREYLPLFRWTVTDGCSVSIFRSNRRRSIRSQRMS